MILRKVLLALTALTASGGLGCFEIDALPPDPPASRPETVSVEIGSELFELELALDPRTRYRGLSGRLHIARNGGMLFANAVAQPQAMVMRDCPNPIDVAFLDSAGRIVAMHAMRPEPPRRPDESPWDYEQRLPDYPSGAPAAFAVETAGGRLAELGLAVGDRLVFDTRAVLERAGRR